MKIAYIACWCKMRIYAIQTSHLKENIEKQLENKIKLITSNCGCFYSNFKDAFTSLSNYENLLTDTDVSFFKLPHFRYHAQKSLASRLMRLAYRGLSEPLRGYYFAKHTKEFDIVHFHQSADAFGYHALKYFLKFNNTSKKIVTIHSFSETQKEKPEVNSLYNLADAVITNTEYLKEKLTGWGVNEKKVHVVPYGSIITPPKNKPRSGAIMFAGSPLINVKGFEYLAPALKTLKDEGKHIQLKLHGYYMPGHQEWAQEIAKKEGIEDLLIWLSCNSEDDLIDAYQGSMCSVIPYTDYSGAFPATMALGTGTPVIASDLMGIPEYVNGNGMVVKGKSVDELSTALRKMYTDDALQTTMSQNALKTANEKYSFSYIARKTTDIYKNVCSISRN